MSNGTIGKILKDFGLTEKEISIYIFLAKRGASKGGEIVKGIKIHKGEVYRLLKDLQSKGIVEATLEVPTRFTSVPFEKVLDSFIKAKKEEVTAVENSKQELLSDWQSINKTGIDLQMEKFVVIEGNRRIYPKILQMVQETKSALSAVSSVNGLLRADQFGLFETISENPLKSNIKFRFLTEITSRNLDAAKVFLKKVPLSKLDLKGKSPELGLPLSPRMVIRDGEEILFFITPKENFSPELNEVCLWTNCKALVQSFIGVFEELWNNSTEIEKKIIEIETGKPTSKTLVISDADTAKTLYYDTLRSAKEEILIMTFPNGIFEIEKNMPLLKSLARKGVSFKIMASIVAENLEVAQQLMKQFEVRHVPSVYLGATTVDGKHFFQFKSPASSQEDSEPLSYFKNTFYTNDLEYVKRTESMLNDIWASSQVPSHVALKAIIEQPPLADKPASANVFDEYRKELKKIVGLKYRMEPIEGKTAEKEILEKIANAKRVPAKDPEKDTIMFYGTMGSAIIYPPKDLNLPVFIIQVNKYNKKSSFGPGSSLMIDIQMKIANDQFYMPAVLATDSLQGFKFRKKMHSKLHTTEIVQLLKKDELKVHLQGNRLFAGWTVPIPLLPPKCVLPPACLVIEGYGKIKAYTSELKGPLNRSISYEFTSLDAFVTLMHPTSKYHGPGTDAILHKDIVTTSRPPSAWTGNDV